MLLFGGHDLEETKWSRQVLKVLLNKLKLLNIIIDIVVPVAE